MDDKQSETIEKLQTLVRKLKAKRFSGSTIPFELAKFASSAIENYLDGDTKSLDAAFGLTPKRGAPGRPEYRLDCARKSLQMKLKGLSWKKIADEFPNDNERNIRRHYKEFKNQVMSEEIAKRCKEDNK